jgi:hypothetical protein
MFRHIINDIERQSDANLKSGMGRFAVILDAIGLSISLDDQCRRDILELSKVRNLIAHRRGLVDHQFVRECPWYPAAVGQRVKVSFDDFERYEKAIAELAVATVQSCERQWTLWAKDATAES